MLSLITKGILIQANCNNILIDKFSIQNTTECGVLINSARYVKMRNGQIAYNQLSGIRIVNTPYIELIDISSSLSEEDGVCIENSSVVSFYGDCSISFNAGYGIHTIGAGCFSVAISGETSIVNNGLGKFNNPNLIMYKDYSIEKLDSIKIDIGRILGLSQENYRLFDMVYSGELLTSAKIKIYNSSSDCNNNINPLATYDVSSTYDTNGKLLSYKVIKL